MKMLVLRLENAVGNLSFIRKFVVVGAIFLLLTIPLLGVIVVQGRQDIADVISEQEGVVYARQIIDTYRKLQAYQLADEDAKDAAYTELETSLDSLKMTNEKVKARFKTEKGVALLSDASNDTRGEALVKILAEVADGSGLTLDPKIDSFYLMDSVTQRLMLYAERGTQIYLSEADQQALLLRDMKSLAENVESGFEKVREANPKVAANLVEAFTALMDANKQITSGNLTGTTVKAASFAAMTLAGMELEALDAILKKREGKLITTLAVDVVATAFCVVLACLILGLIYRSMSGGLRAAISATKAIAEGRLDYRLDIRTRDEIGAVLTAVGDMQQRLIESRETLDRLAEDDRRRTREFSERLEAIGKTQAVVEFDDKRKLIGANQNFLTTFGYALDEIMGVDHGNFVDAAYHQTGEYEALWTKLNRGESYTGQFKRLTKGGAAIWAQTAYSPILTPEGQIIRVVACLTDITATVAANELMENAVHQARDVVAAAMDGNLTHRIELDGMSGPVRDLCGGINALVEDMNKILTQFSQSVETVRSAAREISFGNSDLSGRTEQQAASLEETASSMEELTATVRQNAENAKQANQLVISAADVASKGGRVVGEVVTTMASINESSKKIVDIISVIDGIAFQTNILALNAAVEAARAGEQGRGFAVVAAEVRSLAQRSAGAAKEIKTLIGDSVDKVGNGTQLVEQAGRTMDEIVTSVKRVTDIMSEISAASQEQSQGIEQVNQTITQMDEVTQQNAALVEEASAAARSLEEQAQSLADTLAQYQLEASERERAAATAGVSPIHGTNRPVAARTGSAMPRRKQEAGARTARMQEF